ncbi:centriole, cilia and spindle-associated protein isoform X2 [Gouania willdenowi]|uniref:Centriole, cilia and spindle-associated protein-like n=1 Tax=Gouania willdenowi TaxID=441366 RepID=A0A8C5GS27_GOUWI|nr:centriole, cilia and spindle-associated protein-like isoform X2 [Gouania willdenowi]
MINGPVKKGWTRPEPVNEATQQTTMLTKKVRTEYMKKFRDPKWETFSKCYEDSRKYRLTRRVMEHSHRPWLWEGWDSSSDSSGWSTPRMSRNRVAPLSLPPPPTSTELQQRLSELKISPEPKQPMEDRDAEGGAREALGRNTAPTTGAAVVENGINEESGGSVKADLSHVSNNRPSEEMTTDNGPADTLSSEGEQPNPAPCRRRRRRTPHSEPAPRDSSQDDKPTVVRKAPRPKSQPAISTNEKENRRPSNRLDWTERQMDVRRTPNNCTTSDACVQTHRQSKKRSSNPDRRRARSADLEKMRNSQLTVVDDRWMTEYMRCFSARLR